MVVAPVGAPIFTFLSVELGVLVPQIPLSLPAYRAASGRKAVRTAGVPLALGPFAVDADGLRKLRQSPDLQGSVGYDAPIMVASPASADEQLVPTDAETNTTWTIPAPTGTGDDVRKNLGVDTILPLHTEPVVVAVLDSGIDNTQFKVVGGWSPPGSNSAAPADVHGSMVAWDIRTAAPSAEFYDVGVLKGSNGQPARLSDAALGLDWVLAQHQNPSVAHPWVVCCSWIALNDEFPVGDPLNYTHNPQHPFNSVVGNLVQAGIVVLFAAGNCGIYDYDAACGARGQIGEGRSIRGANGSSQVICVGAADVKGRILSNSSPGPSTYGEPKPDVCGFAAFPGLHSTGDHGTSAACAVAAGAVALLTSCFDPPPAPATVRDALRATATDRGANLPGWDPFWGAGTINVAAAYDWLKSGQVSFNAPILNIADSVVGRAPRSCQRRIRALCQNREEVYATVGLANRERDTIESLDVKQFAGLLGEQMRLALTRAWNGQSSLPPRTPADETDDACGDERPRLLVNLIADLARSPETREAFLTDRNALLTQQYALAPASLVLAQTMTGNNVNAVVDAAQNEVVEFASSPELHEVYPNVQSFPGPWIDYFMPHAGRVGERVEVTIEGRGFAVGKPLIVGLVERKMGTCPKVVSPKQAKVSQTVPHQWFDGVLGQRRRASLDAACALVTAAPTPAACAPAAGDVKIDDTCVRHSWPPELVPPSLRLGTLQLSEHFDPDSSATRFRINVVFDLDPQQVAPGEYDLWVAYCDAPGCEARATVGPTTFSVRL